MFTIVYTKNCIQTAEKLSERLSEQFGHTCLIPVDQALSSPEDICDFDNIGLVFNNDGKSLPLEMQDFIRRVLGNCDLSGLQYMFSLCVCDSKPGHALKIVEKLCAKAGCAPSLSLTIDGNAPSSDLDNIASLIGSGEIRLAKGSLGTMFYMLFHGIRTRD